MVARTAISVARSALVDAARIDLDDFDPVVDVAPADLRIFCDSMMNGSTNPVDLAQVDPWDDQSTNNLDIQNPTPAQRGLVRWPFALFYQKICMFMDGVDDVMRGPSGSNASYVPLHSGTGGLFSLVFFGGSSSTAQDLAATCTGASTDIGFEWRWNGNTGEMIIRLANGSGTFVISVTTPPGSIPRNRINRLVFWFQTGLAPNDEYQLWVNGSLVVAGTVLQVPSGADPTAVLVLGRQTNASARFFSGWYAACHFYTSPLLYVAREVLLLERRFS